MIRAMPVGPGVAVLKGTGAGQAVSAFGAIPIAGGA